MKNFNEGVFKAYDLRGIYPTELNEEFAYEFGRAYSTFLLKKNPTATTVAVGRDMRLSSVALRENLVKGILASGLSVADVGLVSTPDFYFATAYYGYDGGVQVSASHNPKEYNGFKVVLKNAYPVGKNTGLTEIKEIMQNEKYGQQEGGEAPQVFEEKDVLNDMLEEQLANLDLSKIKKFKIVIDTASAMGGPDMEAFFSKVPGEIIKLNFELDGSFPMHEADPLQEKNLAMLSAAVVENGADFGIAIDGDADRYFFVDEKGEPLRQEILRAIMAQIELKQNPGACVCYDIRPGRITRDAIEAMHGEPIVTPVGHSLIKEIMIENDAVFGGESSGHYFYKQSYGTFEMPFILLTKFLQFLSAEEKTFSQMMAPYKQYFHSGEINRTVADPTSVLRALKEKYSDGKISELDGVTVEYPDWWFNVRASNTEPLVRLNLESKSQALTQEKVAEVLALMK